MKRNKSIPLGLALVGVIAIIATLGLFSLNHASTVQAQGTGEITLHKVDLVPKGTGAVNPEITIEFTTGDELEVGDQIAINFEAGFKIKPEDPAKAVKASIKTATLGLKKLGEDTGEIKGKLAATRGSATDSGTITLTVPDMANEDDTIERDIPQGARVTITITEGVTNPADADDYTVKVTTSGTQDGASDFVTVVGRTISDVSGKLDRPVAGEDNVELEVKFTYSHHLVANTQVDIMLPTSVFAPVAKIDEAEAVSVHPGKEAGATVGTASDGYIPITVKLPDQILGGTVTTVTFHHNMRPGVKTGDADLPGAGINIKSSASGKSEVEVSIGEAPTKVKEKGPITKILSPELTNLTAAADPPTRGLRTKLSVTFKTETELMTGDEIIILLDKDFEISEDIDGTDVDISANRTGTTGSTSRARATEISASIDVGEADVDEASSDDGVGILMDGTDYHQINVGVPDMNGDTVGDYVILAGAKVTVTFRADADGEGITNPMIAAKYRVGATTSAIDGLPPEAPGVDRVIIKKLTIYPPIVDPIAPVVEPSVTVTPIEPGAPSRMAITYVAPSDVFPGQEIVVTLEDDWKNQIPTTLDKSEISIRASSISGGGASGGSGAVNPAAVNVSLVAHDDANRDQPEIRLEVPDMGPNTDGPQHIAAGAGITVTFNQGAGIKNPTEGGRYNVDIRIDEGARVELNNQVIIPTVLVLGGEDGDRGDELTMVAKGVEGGESVTFWLDDNGDGVRDANERDLNCTTVAETNDTATCTVIVTNPPFQPGLVNFINFRDSEDRTLGDTDWNYPVTQVDEVLSTNLFAAATWELTPSISVSPTTANIGQRITISLRDFSEGGRVSEIEIGNVVVANSVNLNVLTEGDLSVRQQGGEGSFSFVLPSHGVNGERLPTGKLRMDVEVDTGRVDEDGDAIIESDDKNVTIAGALLTTTSPRVVANQHLSISGNGFTSSSGSDDVCIEQGAITFNGVELEIVDDDDCDIIGVDGIELTSGGTFTLTVGIREKSGNRRIKTALLAPGSHQLKVVDTKGTEGTIELTIPERTLTVMPEVARPRDIVTIRGENFVADHPDGPNVGVDLQYFCSGENKRTVSAQPDSSGNFTETLRIPTDCAIPSTNSLKADVEVSNIQIGIVDTVTHEIPEATVVVTPASGAQGNSFTVTGLGYRTFDVVSSIKIGDRETLVIQEGTKSAHHTDRDGNLRVADLLVPGMDSGVYAVTVTVGSGDRRTTASGTFQILEEGAISVPTGVMGAVEPLGEALVRIFHFNNSDKTWLFYDPRPEFAEANTIDRMFSGQIYWVNVTEDMTLTLNNETRTFTCIDGDCWNQIVW